MIPFPALELDPAQQKPKHHRLRVGLREERPIPGSAVFAGRVVADAVRNLFVVGLMIAVGSAIGFRFHTGPGAALAAVCLAVAVGLAFSWLNLLLSLLVRDPESAGLAGLFPVIVLVFTSSTLVPVDTMPGWLQAFAKVNPITVVVDALRALSLGGPTSTQVVEAIAWIGGSSFSPSPPPLSATDTRPRRDARLVSDRKRRRSLAPPGLAPLEEVDA
jgi:hypothetical protein